MPTSSKKITLKSSDGETFEVEEAVALKSEMIKHMIEIFSSEKETFEVEEATALKSKTIKLVVENNCTGTLIPISNVTSKILAKVIEYCEKHVEDENNNDAVNEQLQAWDADFVKVDQDILFGLNLAANFLNIKGLLDLTCRTIADYMKGKTVEEIRQYFNIKNDSTPEEEEELRKEYQWAF